MKLRVVKLLRETLKPPLARTESRRDAQAVAVRTTLCGQQLGPGQEP